MNNLIVNSYWLLHLLSVAISSIAVVTVDSNENIGTVEPVVSSAGKCPCSPRDRHENSKVGEVVFLLKGVCFPISGGPTAGVFMVAIFFY